MYIPQYISKSTMLTYSIFPGTRYMKMPSFLYRFLGLRRHRDGCSCASTTSSRRLRHFSSDHTCDVRSSRTLARYAVRRTPKSEDAGMTMYFSRQRSRVHHATFASRLKFRSCSTTVEVTSCNQRWLSYMCSEISCSPPRGMVLTCSVAIIDLSPEEDADSLAFGASMRSPTCLTCR